VLTDLLEASEPEKKSPRRQLQSGRDGNTPHIKVSKGDDIVPVKSMTL
jgi:hypothetical protein